MMKIGLLLVALVMPLVFAPEEPYRPEKKTVHKPTSKYQPEYQPPNYEPEPDYYHPKPKHQPKHYCPKPKEHPQTKCYLYSPKYYDKTYETAYREVKQTHKSRHDSYGTYYPAYDTYTKEPYCKKKDEAYFMYFIHDHKKRGYIGQTSQKYYVGTYTDGKYGYDGGPCTYKDIIDYCKMGRHGQGNQKKQGGNDTMDKYNLCQREYKTCQQKHGQSEKASRSWEVKYNDANSKLTQCENSYYDSLGESSTSTESSNSASTLSIVLIVIGAVMLLAGLTAMAVARRQIRKGAADNAPNAVMVA